MEVLGVGSNKYAVDNLLFNVDRAFYGGTQQEIYHDILQTPLLDALKGHSGLVMLCGQKGTGKTYTTCGEDRSFDYRGMLPRALQQIFREMRMREHEYDIRVRYTQRLF